MSGSSTNAPAVMLVVGRQSILSDSRFLRKISLSESLYRWQEWVLSRKLSRSLSLAFPSFTTPFQNSLRQSNSSLKQSFNVFWRKGKKSSSVCNNRLFIEFFLVDILRNPVSHHFVRTFGERFGVVPLCRGCLFALGSFLHLLFFSLAISLQHYHLIWAYASEIVLRCLSYRYLVWCKCVCWIWKMLRFCHLLWCPGDCLGRGRQRGLSDSLAFHWFPLTCLRAVNRPVECVTSMQYAHNLHFHVNKGPEVFFKCKGNFV